MSVPGFGAERSLYRTAGQYQAGNHFGQASGGVEPSSVVVILVVGGVVIVLAGVAAYLLSREPAPAAPPPPVNCRSLFTHCADCDPKCRQSGLALCVDNNCGHTFQRNPGDGSCDIKCT